MPRTEVANEAIREQRQPHTRAAAAGLFARNGHVGTRVDDIAAAVQMSKGRLYHYFGSKAALYTLLVDLASRGTVQLFEAAPHRPGTVADRLKWLVTGVMAGISEQSDMFMVVMQPLGSDAVPAPARDKAVWFARHTETLLTSFIREGQRAHEVRSGDPDQLALLLGSCLQGLAVGYAVQGTMPPIADALVSLFTGTQPSTDP